MAEIFRAKPFNAPDSQKHLALKRILPHLAEDDEFVQMFIDEAQLTVQLVHPNIVRTYELGRFHTSPYILMEFISGKDILELQRLLRQEKRIMSVAMACYVAAQIAVGLDYVHSKTDADGNPLNIIHRDISPQNVLVTYGGKIKIIDFGIAKAAIQQTKTQVGVLKGKFGYMSPEQVHGQRLDGRSDLYTVGILLWEMLTNRRLFRGDNEFETLQKVRDPEIVAPSTKNDQIPPEVDRIVLRALAIDRQKRYQSGQQMAADIQSFLGTIGQPYGEENLSRWMAQMFTEDLEAERQKRQLFQQIRTPADVRRLAGSNDDEEDTAPDDAPAPGPKDLWDADIAPDDDADAERFASEHTIVAAGGFDASQFAEEEEEDVIALDVDDLIEIDDSQVDADVGYDIQDDATVALSRSSEDFQSLQFAGDSTPQSIPNPSDIRRKRRKKLIAAAAAVLALFAAAGLTLYLWTDRSTETNKQVSQVNRPLQPATLVINISPPVGLSVSVDDVSYGDTAPVTVSDLEPGEHIVRVTHPSFEPYERQVSLEPGGFDSLDITLEPRAQGAR